MFFTPGGFAARRGSAFGHVVLSLTMDLNSSSDEEEDAPVAAPPQAKLAITDLTGGATTESMDVDEGNEEVLEVEVEAVWEAEEEEEEEEELDPRTLGLPGLKTLVPGDRVEILWANGAFSPLVLPPNTQPRHLSYSVRAGWERGRVKECVLEMRAGRPVIIYRITYDDGEEVALTHSSHHEPRALSSTQNSRASAARRTVGGGPAHASGTEGSRGGA